MTILKEILNGLAIRFGAKKELRQHSERAITAKIQNTDKWRSSDESLARFCELGISVAKRMAFEKESRQISTKIRIKKLLVKVSNVGETRQYITTDEAFVSERNLAPMARTLR